MFIKYLVLHHFSDHLKQSLDTYVQTLPKVKVIHAAHREGLIRARLLGVAAATGEVLVFLDSHCEATQGKDFEYYNHFIIYFCYFNFKLL